MSWKHYPVEQPKRAGYYLVILEDDSRWPEVKIWKNKEWETAGEKVVKWSEIPPWE